MRANANVEGAEQVTKLIDDFFKLEKDVMDAGTSTDEQKKQAEELYNKIMEKAGEFDLADDIQGFMKQHIDSVLKLDPKPGFGRTDIEEDAIDRAKEKKDLERKHKAEIEREKEEIKNIRQNESFEQWRENKHLVKEAISVADEKSFNKGKGIIIVIDDNGKKVSAIFKNKKNADKFNRNKPSDVKKLLKLAKSKKYPAAIDENESVNEDAKMAKLSDDKLRALLKKLQDFRKKEPKAPSTQFFIKRVEKEMKKRNLTEELRSSQNTKTKKVGSIKSIKKNTRSLPLSRDYILSNEGEVRPMPMRTQMSAAMKMTNYDHPKYGSGFEIETKKGMVLIKPEVAELYMKSRDRLPDPIKKNMDRMAERSPDGLFTVLQAALNDLQTGMIE